MKRIYSNWNNGLLCHAFLTIELWAEDWVGQKVMTVLHSKDHCPAIVLEAKKFHISQMNPFYSYLTFGADPEQATKGLTNYFKGHDLQNTQLALLLIRMEHDPELMYNSRFWK